MTRDYKTPVKNRGRKSGSPLLVGLFIGLFIGLGIALAVAFFLRNSPSPFLEMSRPDSAKSARPTAQGAPAAQPGAGESAGKPAERPRFDFYTILPGAEEPVTEQEIKQAASQPAGAAKDQFFLQVGSFQSEADADNLKAKLALLGIEASIQTASLPDKGVWHRVRVGPFASIEELNQARAVLAQNGIQATPLKVRAAAAR